MTFVLCTYQRSFVCVGGWGNVLCERALQKRLKHKIVETIILTADPGGLSYVEMRGERDHHLLG